MGGDGTSEVRLGDLVSIKHGWPFKSSLFSQELTGQPIVVNIGNFSYTGGFRFESTTVKEYRGEYPAEFELKPGEILLIMTCQTPRGEILGVPGRVPNDGRTYLHNQRMGRVVVTRPDAVHVDYLFWLFLSPEFNRYLATTASGSKILHTSPSRIEEFRSRLPPLPEQRRIAAVLGSLDDKIELNRRLAGTVEATARELFKSWFVEFRPVRALAAGKGPAGLDSDTASLFPQSMSSSRIGPLPEGWTIATVGSQAEVIKGRSYRSSELGHSKTALVTLKSVARGGGYRADGLKAFTGQFLAGQVVRPGELVVACTDVTQRAQVVGRPALVGASSEFTTLVASLDLSIVRPRHSHLGVAFFYCLFVDEAFAAHATARATGTTVLHLAADALPNYEFVCPPPGIAQKFSALARPLFAAIEALETQSANLAATRSTLLVELMT